MADKRPSPFSLVLVPAAITLMVTIARLLGELYEWSPTLFGEPKAGGDNAMIGIGWLIFVFGLWFGFRLQRSGQGTGNKGRALLISAIALMVAFGGIFGAKAAGLVTFPDKEHPGEVVGVAYFAGAMVLGALVSIAAFPRLGVLMLVYAVLARLPVVAVTWLALQYDWNTHYVKLPDGLVQPPDADPFLFLSMPQYTFWPCLTVMFGTLMGCLGAFLAGGGKPKK